MVVYGGGPSRGMDFEELNEMVGDGIMLPRFASPPLPAYPRRLPLPSLPLLLPAPPLSPARAPGCLAWLARYQPARAQPTSAIVISLSRPSERATRAHTHDGWLAGLWLWLRSGAYSIQRVQGVALLIHTPSTLQPPSLPLFSTSTCHKRATFRPFHSSPVVVLSPLVLASEIGSRGNSNSKHRFIPHYPYLDLRNVSRLPSYPRYLFHLELITRDLFSNERYSPVFILAHETRIYPLSRLERA